MLSPLTPCSAPSYCSKVKIRFQSFFMLMTAQPHFFAGPLFHDGRGLVWAYAWAKTGVRPRR